MKVFLLLLLCTPFLLNAQTNTFPSSGNVGIGTINPSAPLDVVGQIKSSSGITISPNGSSYGNTIYSNNGLMTFSRPLSSVTGTALWTLSNGGANADNNPAFVIQSSDANGSNAYKYITFARANGVGNYNILLDPNGTSGVWIGGNTTGGNLRVQGSTYLAAAGGNVGIGTTNPSGALEILKGSTWIQMAPNGTGLGDMFRVFGVNGSAFSANSYVPSNGNLITDLGINYSVDGGNGTSPYTLIGTKRSPILRLSAEDGSIALYGENGTGTDYRTPSFKLGLFVQGDGKVGIGTNNTQGYQFAVNGDAIFTKVKVKTYATWPDYVFHRNYKLRPLKDLENFIKLNNHLPDVPSASEVEKKGLDLGDNQALLLKKIEELTLYIIDQDKKIDSQQNEIKDLKDQNKELEDIKKELEIIKTKLEN